MAQLTTFVFTDLVGSVALKRRMPGADAATRDLAYVERILQPHRARIEACLAEADGRVVSTAGDGHFLVFPDVVRATQWALAVARVHREDPLGAGEAVHAAVRIGLHAGVPQLDPADPDNFVGRAVDLAARIADHAQGGQVLVSRTAAALLEDCALDGVKLHSHGRFDLRGVGSTELFEVLDAGRRPTAPRRVADETPERSWTVLPRTIGLTEYAGRSARSVTEASGSATTVRRRLGNYELGELLGAGGMGNVYKARHAQFDRPRAVKVIRPELVAAGGESVVRRFYQEVRATGAIEHPNLVVAIDSSSPDDTEHYLVMEFVDGVGVDRLLEAEGPLPVADACEVCRQAALGLAHLHEAGLVHRDVKPSNLMVTLAATPHLVAAPEGLGARRSGSAARLPVVKLLDLGLALLVQGDDERVTRFDRGGMGTGYYMSPEQWRTTSVDARADVYSLGCTLYCLLAGEPPFARSDLRPERAHASESPPPLRPGCGLPRELEKLIGRMLAKRPEDRPQSMPEVAEALTPLAAGNRLAERVTRLQTGSPAIRREETRTEQPSLIDTRSADGRRLDGRTASSPAPKPLAWLIAALATAAACGAVLAAYAFKTQRDAAALAESLESAAGLTARELASAVDSRIRALETVSGEPRLQEWLAPGAPAANAGLDDRNRPLQAWLVDRRSHWDEKLGFRSSSWFVTDAAGVQVARAPYSPESVGQSYARRDYFHGRGADLPEGAEGVEPIRGPHRSAVYESTSERGELKVAFSAPIYGVTSGQGAPPVIGVVAMSISLGDFAEFQELEATTGAEILLIDTGLNAVEGAERRGLVLHPRPVGPRRVGGAPPGVSEQTLEEVASLRGGSRGMLLAHYADPLGRPGDCRGAAAPVAPKSLPPDERGAWVVIVQKRQP